MKLFIRTIFFFIFTVVSVVCFLTSVAAQTGPGTSPAQAELTRATAARQEAEQQVATAQTALDSATTARQAAEQQLAGAQTALDSATTALQAAEQAVQQEADELAQEEAEKAARLATAGAALQEAEQQLASALTALESATAARQLLEQRLADAKNKEAKTQELVTQAKAQVHKFREEIKTARVDDCTVINIEPPLHPPNTAKSICIQIRSIGIPLTECTHDKSCLISHNPSLSKGIKGFILIVDGKEIIQGSRRFDKWYEAANGNRILPSEIARSIEAHVKGNSEINNFGWCTSECKTIIAVSEDQTRKVDFIHAGPGRFKVAQAGFLIKIDEDRLAACRSNPGAPPTVCFIRAGGSPTQVDWPPAPCDPPFETNKNAFRRTNPSTGASSCHFHNPK